MIRKLVRQMLTAQVLSALTVSVCLLIDNIMIGRFLGVQAIAAYGYANPILLATGAVGSMLAAGVQVVCSRSLGKGAQEETNAGYSAALAVTGAVSVVFIAVVLLFRNPLATLMGAGSEGQVYDSTRDYMAGFIIGTPGSIGALILVPFLQMAGQSTLLIVAVVVMTVTDVVLDLLSVLVFHGGMFGMGLASSLSYYAALLVSGFYFFSKKCVFRFSPKLVSWRKIGELVRGGVPTVFNMASTIVLVFVMNRILRDLGGDVAVAAFSVVTSLGNASNCVSTGMGGVTLTLSGILYNEEDRTGLRELLRLLVPRALGLGVVAAAVMIVVAPWAVRLFIDPAEASYAMAVRGVRWFSAGLIPCCLNNAFKSLYQGTDRVGLTELISVCEGAVLPILAALASSALSGLSGVWVYFLAGEALTTLGVAAGVCLRKHKLTARAEDYLLLSTGFGVPDQDLLEMQIQDMRQVAEAARTVGDFCRAHGRDDRMSNRLALCVEEMAGNTVTHGFTGNNPKGEPRHLSIRLQDKADRWVLRFRDDCTAFDPVHYIPRETGGEKGLGIRIVLAMADEVRYTYSMNLNNLTIILGGNEKQPEGGI